MLAAVLTLLIMESDMSQFPLRASTPSQLWDDAAWQMRHSYTSAAQLEGFLALSDDERDALALVGEKLAFRVTPHFMSLIDPNDPMDPLRLQVIPRMGEMFFAPEEYRDPCGEDADMKIPGLVHRYPDRVLLLCTDRCATYCRYCTRSRLVSSCAEKSMKTDFEAAYAYIREHTEIRDVLLSGGDPLLLSDERLRDILSKLHAIPHVEFLRIGTRVPLVLPQRVTPALCEMLREFAPLFISLHCNHAKELSPDGKRAIAMLADHGLPLGSQTVLLRGVNDSIETQRELYHALLRCRVRPYYLYQCDLVHGSRHFRTAVSEGLAIMEALQGHTSGYALPQFVIDAPNGGGKIPIHTQTIIAEESGILRLRNFRGEDFFYPND